MKSETKIALNRFFNTLIFCFVFLFCSILQAQHNNNWVLGLRKGITFNSVPPHLIKSAVCHDTTPQHIDEEAFGTCSYSDCNGDLLVYGSHNQLWNKKNKPLKNGYFFWATFDSTLIGQPYFSPVLLSLPQSNRYLYFFYMKSKGGNGCGSSTLLYALIDLNGDNGLGEVIVKDKVLDSSMEICGLRNCNITKAMHANKKFCWLIHGPTSTTSKAYLITDTGIVPSPVTSSKVYSNNFCLDENRLSGSVYNNMGMGYYKMTRDYKNLIISGIESGTTKFGCCLMYDFDNATGIISNPQVLLKFSDIPRQTDPQGPQYFSNYFFVEVAPNDTFIYFSTFGGPRYVPGRNYLVQVNRYTGAKAILKNGTNYFWGLQIGPDGKIYSQEMTWNAYYSPPKLIYINRPNEQGLGCDITDLLNDSNIYTYYLPTPVNPYTKLYYTSNTRNNNSCVDTAVFDIHTDDQYQHLTVYFGDGDSVRFTAPLKQFYRVKHRYQQAGRYGFRIKGKTPDCNWYNQVGDSIDITLVPEYYPLKRTVTPGCGLSQLNIRDSFHLTTKAVYQWGNSNDTVKLNGQPTSAINQQQYTKGTKAYWQLTLSNNECPNYKTIKDSATLQYLTLPKIKYVVNTAGAGDSMVIKNNNKHYKGCAPLNFSFYDTTNALKGGTLQLPTIYHVYQAGHLPKQITLQATKEAMAVINDTTLNGCTASDTFYLTAYETPVIQFRIDSSRLCLRENTIWVSNASEGGQQYKLYWGDGDSATIDSGKQLQHKYPFSKAYTLQLKTRNREGCAAEHDSDIKVYPMPKAGFSINQKEQCQRGNKFVLSSNDSLSKFHQWQQGSNTNTASTATYRFANSGTYTVKHISVSANNCRDTATDSLYVWPTPVAAMQVNDTSQCLQNHQVVSTLNTTFTGNIQHTMLWGDGQQSSLQGNGMLSHQYTTSGNYSLRLIAASLKGCADSVSSKIKIAPSPKLKLRADGFCFGDSTSIAVTNSSSTQVATYQWWINTVPQNIPESMFSVLFTALGQQSIAVKGITAEGCTDSASLAINILEKPIADFTFANLTNGNDLKYYFLNQSQYSTAWYWTFGTADTALQKNPYHYFAQPGDVKVRLIATNQNICFDTTEKIVPVFNKLDFYFPTGVSADGNGLNDGFGLHPSQLQYVAEYHIEIFNRWGGKEFETNDMNKLWYPESKMNTIYIYIAQVRDIFNILHEYKGIVEVIR